MAEDLVRTVYARVKTESVCFTGRVEKDGAHAKRRGGAERTCVNDSRRSMARTISSVISFPTMLDGVGVGVGMGCWPA
jgi:hypothetical protein